MNVFRNEQRGRTEIARLGSGPSVSRRQEANLKGYDLEDRLATEWSIDHGFSAAPLRYFCLAFGAPGDRTGGRIGPSLPMTRNGAQ